MDKINRAATPQWLAEKSEVWDKEWQAKYQKTGDGSKFAWRQHKGFGKGDLVEKLSLMTQYHCLFCDAYPMRAALKETIEHFRPKSEFPLLAYDWDNLFICCPICQEKGDRFDDRLLKPDDGSYDFDTYFDIDWATGKLIPNLNATSKQQQKASCTITLYKLNDYGRPGARLTELKKFNSTNLDDLDDLDDWSYRYFLFRGSQ